MSLRWTSPCSPRNEPSPKQQQQQQQQSTSSTLRGRFCYDVLECWHYSLLMMMLVLAKSVVCLANGQSCQVFLACFTKKCQPLA